jgi:tRNA-splicing ligase RtcB
MDTIGDKNYDSAYQQIDELTRLPFVDNVNIMPDFHAGMGATIGSVFTTDGFVIPAAIGADLGCGMQACRLSIKVDEIYRYLFAIKEGILREVPVGRTNNGDARTDKGSLSLHSTEDSYVSAISKYEQLVDYKTQAVLDQYPDLVNSRTNTFNHLGTIGTGNHFIEICGDENDNVWVMVHTGSRGIGSRIGNYFLRLAQSRCKLWGIELPNQHLAYLPTATQEGQAYLTMMDFAQRFARLNRDLIMDKVIREISKFASYQLLETIDCHHNFANVEKVKGKDLLVTRKGAIRIPEGELGIIPGSMGRKSYIVKGLRNYSSLHSASHGAGRLMSRTKAKSLYSTRDLDRSMIGIVYNDEYKEDLVDEIGDSYKPIDEVMEQQKELVTPVYTLNAVLNIKG